MIQIHKVCQRKSNKAKEQTAGLLKWRALKVFSQSSPKLRGYILASDGANPLLRCSIFQQTYLRFLVLNPHKREDKQGFLLRVLESPVLHQGLLEYLAAHKLTIRFRGFSEEDLGREGKEVMSEAYHLKASAKSVYTRIKNPSELKILDHEPPRGSKKCCSS